MRRLEALSFPNSRAMNGKPLVRNLDEQIISAEQGRILHWSLIGARRVLAQNSYTRSEQHAEYINSWKRRANPVVAFVEEYLERDDDAKLKRSDVYPYFQLWAIQEEIDDIPTKGKVFEKLEELGFRPRKTGGEYFYTGWRIKQKHARTSDDGALKAPPLHERDDCSY